MLLHSAFIGVLFMGVNKIQVIFVAKEIILQPYDHKIEG